MESSNFLNQGLIQSDNMSEGDGEGHALYRVILGGFMDGFEDGFGELLL